MSETLWADLAYATGVAIGLWVGANAAMGSLSVLAAVILGCATFGFLQLAGLAASAVYKAIRRAREATR